MDQAHLFPEDKQGPADDDGRRQEDLQDEGSTEDGVLDVPRWLLEGVSVHRFYAQAARNTTWGTLT